MLLYKYIDIGTAWAEIQQRYQDLHRDIQGNRTRVEQLDTLECTWLENTLAPQLKQLSGLNHTCTHALLFAGAPMNQPIIHMDGQTLARTYNSRFAVNIPIVESGEMQWYGGKYKLIEHMTPDQVHYLHIQWMETPKMIGRAVIDQPTLVNIDIPHRVCNINPRRRLGLSTRWNPDINVYMIR